MISTDKPSSFSAALEALKAGYFVRHGSWGFDFAFLMGPLQVPTEKIGDEKIRELISTTTHAGLTDPGNFRRVNLASGVVVNGWMPSFAEMLSDEWFLYDTDEAAQRMRERELRDALRSSHRFPLHRENLIKMAVEQLDALGIERSGSYKGGDAHIDLLLLGDYEGITLRFWDGRYSILTFTGQEGQTPTERYGEGSIASELGDTMRDIGRDIGSRQEQFYRTVFVVDVLSQGAIAPEISLEEILTEIGDDTAAKDHAFVGAVKLVGEEAISARTASMAAAGMGVDPSALGILALDSEGNLT